MSVDYFISWDAGTLHASQHLVLAYTGLSCSTVDTHAVMTCSRFTVPATSVLITAQRSRVHALDSEFHDLGPRHVYQSLQAALK